MEHTWINDPDKLLKSMVRVSKKAVFVYQQPKAELPNETIPKENKNGSKFSTNDWYPWGDSNQFPQEVMKDARKSNVLKRGLKTLARVHYGSGPIYYTLELNEKGLPTVKRLYITEIEQWLEKTNAYGNQMELILDLETFHNGWTEYYFNKSPLMKGAEIIGYKRQKAVYCRHKKQDESGAIKSVFISAKWPNPGADERAEIKYYYDGIRDKKHALFHRYSSMDEGIYYELAEWDTVRKNGWLEVSYTVPMIKKAIFKNQATIKYHIEIPSDYFAKNCANWDGMNEKEREKMKDKVEKALEDYLADVENSGKSVTTYKYKDALGNETGITITAIDNKLKDGAYLPDATAGNAETLFALGINPGIIGVGIPGSRDSQGSGSYVREELWKMQALISADRYISLEPLRHISRINKWAEKYNGGKPIHWAYGDISTLDTLNENKQGRKDIIQGQPGTNNQ